MRITITTALILLFLTLMSCRNKEISGTITGYQTDSLFLYKAKGERTFDLEFLKSIPVINGKFTFSPDSLTIGLYCLSVQNAEQGEQVNDYAFLFLEPIEMRISISKEKQKAMHIHATGSVIEEHYAAFTETKLQEKNRMMYDKLERDFYEAYEKGDTIEMERTKELSVPYYNNARTKLTELIDTQIEKYKGTFFALYLYSTYMFPDEDLDTKEKIAVVRKHINSFDQTSRQSDCYKEMEKLLDRFEKCAVGCEAPDIAGVDKAGRTVRLNDFRGKYVLIDFWSSSCGWCRLETPVLQKTYQTFKDKGFTIFGVSSDHRKDDWIKAMEEDNSNWDQVLLDKTDIDPTMRAYCISGFPHILLIDPNGIVLAKELRGDDIYQWVEKSVL